jgi:hypothetical protein
VSEQSEHVCLDTNDDKEQTAFAPSKIGRSRGGGPMADVPSKSSNLQFPDWQSGFEAALRERDQAKRAERLRAAKTAIFLRLKTKVTRPPGTLERIALNDAIHLLRILRSERLPFIDWDNS